MNFLVEEYKENRIPNMASLNLSIGKPQLFLIMLVCYSVLLENSCHGQFHWAKSGRRDARLLKELLQDLVKDSGDPESEPMVTNW